MQDRDPADYNRLAEAVEAIVPSLAAFQRFEGRDPAALQRGAWSAVTDRALPDAGAGLDAVIEELAASIIPYGLRTGAPGFSGWVTSAPSTGGVIASLAATVAGSQRWWVQPFNRLETIALLWLRELLGLPADLQGVFVSGGSAANLIGLGAARQAFGERLGIDIARDGLPPGLHASIYASSEVHHVVLRAAAVLGLGRRAVTSITADADGRIDVAALEARLADDRRAGIAPLAIVANAGTVNTGAVDPIKDLIELAKANATWLHVDGAYGLFGRLDHRVARLFDGLNDADSVVVDPHKWLNTPVGCGAAFVRDGRTLGRAFTLEPAEYLEGRADAEADVTSPFDDLGDRYHDFSIEQSAPSRGVLVWAVLREIGADGMRQRVRRHIDFARHLARRVTEHPQLELLAEPVLSICCFRYHPPGLDDEPQLDALNTAIAARLRAESRTVPSTTRVNGRLAIRPCYINPRTSHIEVDALADAVADIGAQLQSSK